MPSTRIFSTRTVPRDLTAGLVVFLVALPLCLGVALASGAPLFSGVLAGVVGGILGGAPGTADTRGRRRQRGGGAESAAPQCQWPRRRLDGGRGRPDPVTRLPGVPAGGRSRGG